MVRAIESRSSGGKQTAEAIRTQAVDEGVRQGYILTRPFYDGLAAFEKDPSGIRNAYSGFLDKVDVKREEKAASEVQFAAAATPELLQLSGMKERQVLVTAEKRLAAGDAKGAQELAQQALHKKIGDQGRALVILAPAGVSTKNMSAARDKVPQT